MKNISVQEIELRKKRGDLLIGYQRAIDLIESAIDNYAKAYIKDFHFLDHKVSTFWRCEQSPIGMCVFNLNSNGYEQDCRYCHGPKERK